jgi:hypothetical protein
MGVCTSCLADMSDAVLDDGLCPNCNDSGDDLVEDSLKDFIGYSDNGDE